MTTDRNRASGKPIETGELSGDAVTVVVVAICSLGRLERTLSALAVQEAAPPFEIVVAADPAIGSLETLKAKHAQAKFVTRDGCRTPIELTSLALKTARGQRILLTEDSCLPHPRWVTELVNTPWQNRAAVGGVVEPGVAASPAMWAFYYVDFFRYMRPVEAGTSPSLSVCNVAYHRSHLDELRRVWEEGFHETEMHRALVLRFGPLYLCPDAEVRVRRDVRFGDAVYERYAFGRLFGATRVAHAGTGRRGYYVVFSPALPVLLLARMTGRGIKSASARGMFLRAFPYLVTLVLAWSWGEWLGYLTRRRPGRITVAPELSDEE